MAEAQATSATPASGADTVKPQRMGFDPTRPFRYAFSFLWGTAKGLMNGMATGGQKGLWLGVMTALLCLYIPPFFGAASVALAPLLGFGMQGGVVANLMVGGGVGFLAGATLMSAVGTVTGGVREITRNARREKDADDLAAARDRRGPRYISYRDRYEQQKRNDAYNRDRLQQIDRISENDTGTYWRDQVSSQSRSSGRGF